MCQAMDIDIELVRGFSRRVTREQVKKMEFLERAGSRDQTKMLLAVLGAKLPDVDEEAEDDGDDC